MSQTEATCDSRLKARRFIFFVLPSVRAIQGESLKRIPRPFNGLFMKIYKYKIDIVNRPFKMTLPQNFKPIAFQEQRKPYGQQAYSGPLMLWGLVDDNQNTREFTFICVGTGVEFDHSSMSYIGTAQSEGFVWHLFVDATF